MSGVWCKAIDWNQRHWEDRKLTVGKIFERQQSGWISRILGKTSTRICIIAPFIYMCYSVSKLFCSWVIWIGQTLLHNAGLIHFKFQFQSKMRHHACILDHRCESFLLKTVLNLIVLQFKQKLFKMSDSLIQAKRVISISYLFKQIFCLLWAWLYRCQQAARAQIQRPAPQVTAVPWVG